jgi:hypothetical protein
LTQDCIEHALVFHFNRCGTGKSCQWPRPQ